MTPFSLIYTVVAAILMVVVAPFLLLLSFKKKYRYSIPKRFFPVFNPPFEKESIWFHVCSFGETISLKPLIARLDERVNISVVTNTGYEAARKYDADVRYLPFELFLPWWIKKQKVLVVSEAELWYMLFFTAKKSSTKTVLINARISDNSYQSYRKFSWFYRRIFAHIDVVFAQSEKDKERLELLGAKHVSVSGNIKAFADIKVRKIFTKPIQEVITLASTHEGEERLLLEALDFSDKKLIVVPRHPERFEKVGSFLRDKARERGLRYHAFSQREDFDSDIVLVDKMGELINIYAISDKVLLGGSFVENVGGHNPIEPATFGCKILSGAHFFNQRVLYEMVNNIEICEVSEIPSAMEKVKKSEIVTKVDIESVMDAILDVDSVKV